MWFNLLQARSTWTATGQLLAHSVSRGLTEPGMAVKRLIGDHMIVRREVTSANSQMGNKNIADMATSSCCLGEGRPTRPPGVDRLVQPGDLSRWTPAKSA